MSLRLILICLINLVAQFSCQNQCTEQQCLDSNKKCIDPTYSQCIDSLSNCQSYQFLNQYIGRDVDQYQCLANNQTANSNVQCYNSTLYKFCIPSSLNKCIDYSKEPQLTSIYVGLQNNTDRVQSLFKCLQVNDLATKSQIISLKVPYCLDGSNYIRNLTLSYNNYVGIDALNFTCLTKDQTATNSSISYCSVGFCKYNNTCTKLSYDLPTKLYDLSCAKLNTPSAIECFQDSQFTSQSICLDQENNICSQIQDLSKYSIGILPNGTCVQQNKVYDAIQLCSDQSCIIKNGTGFSCIPFDDVYVGIDQQQLCLKRNQTTAIRCRKIKFCKDQNKACVDLFDDQQQKLWIGRQINTTNCLPFTIDYGDNIEMCADGYCLYSATHQQNTDYCIPYGGYLQQNGPFIGVESVTERCLLVDQYVKSVKYCFGLKFCKLTLDQQQACVKLDYPFSYDYVNPQLNNYAARNLDGTCQSINQANSVSCAENHLCLQIDKCISLNDNNNQDNQIVGRDANTQQCIESGTYFAIYCKLDYCLYKNKCFKLDSYYVGREFQSSNCLIDSQQTKQKIKQCLNGYCINQISSQSYSCIRLDYDPLKNSIGNDKDSNCLGVGKPVAVKCFEGMACLEQNTCQIVDSDSTYKCSDSQNMCSQSIDNCSSCNFKQCIDPQNGKTCVSLGTNCQDWSGQCADTSSGHCKVCPKNTCLDVNKGTCISFLNIVLKSNQCIKYVRPDLPCIFVDMNIYNDSSDLLCANQQNLCVLQSQANASLQCLRCPLNFLNLGDNRCLTIQERDTDKTQNTNLSLIFELNILNIVEDNCLGKICKQQNINKCPIGCYSCIDLNICTKCIEGYFLFKSNDNSAQCIQCDYKYNSVSSFQDTYRVPLSTTGKTQISQKCLDCSLGTGLWKENQMPNKICQQVILKYSIDSIQSISMIENQPSFAMSYTLSTQSYCTFCQFQLQNNQYVQVCLKCALGYYLNKNGQCTQCASGCVQCELGFIDNLGIKQYYYEYNQEYRQSLINLVLIPLCQVCQPQQQLISYNLTTCDSCGNNCTSCQYVNSYGYFNIGYKNNIQLTDELYQSNKIFKQCSTCQKSSQTLQSNGQDCGDQMQNCVLHTLQNTKTSQIKLVYDLSYFSDGSFSSELICVECQNSYILSNSKKYCLQNSQVTDVNCIQFHGDSSTCKKCKQFALDTEKNICDVNFQCDEQLIGCSKCLYQYETSENDKQNQIQYFTCVECIQDNYMVTLLGCKKCQEGCSRCYEMGYDSKMNLFNLTAHILYEDFNYNITTRLNYQSILNTQTYCSSCLDGYYYDPIQKSCTLYPCGRLCNNCIFQMNKFFCIECNQTAILQSILPVQLYMGNFFFQQNYISKQLQIGTFTSDQKQCQPCPFLCETCDQTDNPFNSDYSIYQTKCFSCKTISQLQQAGQTNFQSYFNGYEIRFDKDRLRCTLCKINDQSCYFKKYTKLYVNCNKYSNIVGDGTIQNPLNLNMLSEVSNFDNLILGEKNPNLAFVALNEISLKELDLELIFSSEIKECFALKALEIKSKLQQKIQTLQIFHLNITYEQSTNMKQLPFIQICPMVIEGFTNVSLSNLNVTIYNPFFDQFKYGFKISSSVLNQVYFSNMGFYRKYEGPSNVLLIQINNLISNLIIQGVSFSNLTYDNSQVIQLQYSQNLVNPKVQILLDSVNLFHITFNTSSFLTITQNNTIVNFKNSLIQHSNLVNSSDFFSYQIFNQYFVQMISLSNIVIQNNFISSYSRIFSSNAFTSASVSNVSVINNKLYLKTLTQDENPSLFESNCLETKSISIQNNQISQYVIFGALKQKLAISSNQFILVDIQYNENIIQSNQHVFFIDKKQLINQFTIQQVKIKNNQIITEPSQSFQESAFISLSNVQGIFVNDISLTNYGQIKFLQVFQVNNFKINNLNGLQSKAGLNNFSIIEIDCLYFQMILKNVNLQNINYQKSLIQIKVQQKLKQNEQNQQILQIKNIQILNCTSNITQQLISISPIHIESQVEESLLISNLFVQDSFLRYSIKADESPSKIATCAYLEALIGDIQLTDSKFFNNFSFQKNNCIVVNTKQLTVNNSIFKNKYSNIDSSNSTVKGGLIQSFVQIAKFTNSHFEGGKAFQGGAIYLVFNTLGFLNIENSSFVNNLSYNQFNNQNFGGALYVDSQACNFQAEILQTSFIQNIAYYIGGAIFIQNSSFKKVVNIKQSEFIDNFSQYGSVLYFNFQEMQKNVFILTDSQFSYNPINTQQSIQKQSIKKNLGQLNFNVQQLFLSGFIEISILESQFMSDQQYQYNSITQNSYGIKTFLQIQNTQYFIDQSNQYQNIIYQVSLISLLNIQKANILNSKFYRILSLTAKLFLQINANYTQIYNTYFQSNKCMQCDNGLVQLHSFYLNLLNSVFEQNQVLDKGALYISQIQIFNSNDDTRILQGISDLNYSLRLSFIKFTNNFSQKSGGAVFIDSSSASFYNCTFVQNTAQNGNGGAIYYKGQEKKTNIQIKKSSFVQNIAQIGGAVYSESGQPVDDIQSQNYFDKNIAKQFSSNVYQSPYKMVPLINGTNLVRDKIVHTSGKIKTDVSIQFMTEDDQFFKINSQNMTLNIQLNDTQNAYLSSQQIIQQSGNFQLNNLVLYGVFGLTIKLTFTSDQIKNHKQDQLVVGGISYQSQFNSVDIIFQFVDGCEIGYQHSKMQKYDFCYRCSDPFYNLFPGQRCLKCPQYGVCDGGMIYLKKGYWRFNLNSSDVYQCNLEVNTCLGDIDIYKSKNQINRKTEIRYCQKGFLGPLCSDCDIYGKYWNDSYVQDGSLGCINCSQTVNTTWLYVLIILFNSITTLYMVNSQLKQVSRSLQIKTLFLLKVYIPRNIQQTNFYIKLITSYLQIFMIVSDIIKAQLYKYQVFISPLSDPNKKALFSLDCSFIDYYKSSKLNYIIIKVIFGQVTIVVYILIFILLYLIQRIITKQKINLIDFITGINFVYLINQPSIVQQIIGSAVCVEQYGKVYIRNYSSFDCNEDFYKNRNYILIPLLGFWTIIIPLYLFKKLYNIRYTLNQLYNLKVLGIFYLDFKDKFYFWELVKISLKSIIVIVNNQFSDDQNPLKASMLCFILLAYSILIKQYQPNINQTLNYMEQLIYILCSISIGLCTYLSENQISKLESSKNAALYLLFIINIYSAYFLIKNIIYIILKEQISNFGLSISQKLESLPRLKNIFKKIGYNDKNRTLQLWKTLRKTFQSSQYKITYMDNNNRMKECLTKFYQKNKLQTTCFSLTKTQK
ncbi:hypothetical protein ABPG74_002738 [Tetrahymena malaccensis]